ncbi:hypothetical protein DMENIID0001_101650 [Sergentomyia squamirostris]
MELRLVSTKKFFNLCPSDQKIRGDEKISAISKNGRLCWFAFGSQIEVMSLATGTKVSSYNFQHTIRSISLNITCVSEIDVPGVNTVVLAVCLKTSAFNGVICLYSVQGSRPLQLISIDDGITSSTFLAQINLVNILTIFDGCLAIGTDTGKVILINLNLTHFRTNMFECKQELKCHVEPTQCTIVDAESSEAIMEMVFKQSVKERTFFGVKLMTVDEVSPITALLDLPKLTMLATGSENGCLVLYDLQKLEGVHKAYPPKEDCPLLKLNFMEPADDPRGHVYIWTMHSWMKMPIAVMHSITTDDQFDEETSVSYKHFKSSRPCLTIPNYTEQLYPLDCQTFSSHLTPDDPQMSICLLSWGGMDGKGQILIFDLNQWYKEQLPEYAEWQDKLTFLAMFPVSTKQLLCNVWLDEKSVTGFNSIQRPEEHFYPNSLAFNCVCITEVGCEQYHWSGLQNKALENFIAYGPKAILQPDQCFSEMLEAVLLPQFSEFNHSENSSITAKRDLLLSIALEYNCVGILRECAKVWADGSHLGRQPFEGLSLSTLTQWIWQRVGAIRECCETLCQPLSDSYIRRLDVHSTKTLAHCTRQLRLLAELSEMILKLCSDYIPHEIRETLTEQLKSMTASAEYHEVLQWLLNVGLLPEGQWSQSSQKSTGIPYPYPILEAFYDKQRITYHSLTGKEELHTGECSCSLLYIDTFIEKECCGSLIRTKWRRNDGNGLYPPKSLQAMISIFLLTDIPVDNKYALFMYLLLDLDMTMKDEEKYAGIIRNLIKFPAVFKMNTSLIKTTQAFWKLDHGDLEGALDDLVSPLGQDKHLSQWQIELLIECLLVQDNLCLALRALQAPGPPISPHLEMRTLLANSLVCEAFQFQRSRGDSTLLRNFFKMCWDLKLIGKILSLALTESDEEILGDFLKSLNSTMAGNLQFSYLLQRSKYMEALTLVADLQKKQHFRTNVDKETPSLVMDAYNSTMTPSVRHLSQMLFKQQPKHEHKSADPIPLSSNLISQRRSLDGGIFQKSAAAVEDATLSWLFQSKSKNSLATTPFVRRPIQEFMLKPERNMVYPKTVDSSMKRKIESPNSSAEMGGITKKYRIDDHSRLLTSFPQKKASQFDHDLQRQLGKIKDTVMSNKTVLSESTMKFFQVEDDGKEGENVEVVETEIMDNSLERSKEESFLGATKRPSLRADTSNRSIVSIQDSSTDEFFSPNTSRIELESFEGPKPRRSLKSVTPEKRITTPHFAIQAVVTLAEEVSPEKPTSPEKHDTEDILEKEETKLAEVNEVQPEEQDAEDVFVAEVDQKENQEQPIVIDENEKASTSRELSIPEIIVTWEDTPHSEEKELQEDEINVEDSEDSFEKMSEKVEVDESDLEDDSSRDSLKIVEDESLGSEEVIEEVIEEIVEEEIEEEEDDDLSVADESISDVDVPPPKKKLLINPAVKFAQKKSQEDTSENVDSEGEEEQADEEEVEEEIDVEEADEEESDASDSVDSDSDEEAARAKKDYKLFHKDHDKLKESSSDISDRDSSESSDGGDVVEKKAERPKFQLPQLPFRKPLVSNEVIDILDSSSEDEDRHFEEEVRGAVETEPYYDASQEIVTSTSHDVQDSSANVAILEVIPEESENQNPTLVVQSDDLYGDLDVQEESHVTKDELNNALLVEGDSNIHEDSMEVSEMDDSVEVLNKGAIITTVFSNVNTPEPTCSTVLNTGALMTTVFSTVLQETTLIVDESSLNVLETGHLYDEEEEAKDLSFKSCPPSDQSVETIVEKNEVKKEESPIKTQDCQEETDQDELKKSPLPPVLELSESVAEPEADEEKLKELPIAGTSREDFSVQNISVSVEQEKKAEEKIKIELKETIQTDTSETDSVLPLQVNPEEVEEEKQEVIEIIPPPKFAYQTTLEDEETFKSPQESKEDSIPQENPEISEDNRQEVIEVIPPPKVAYQTQNEESIKISEASEASLKEDIPENMDNIEADVKLSELAAEPIPKSKIEDQKSDQLADKITEISKPAPESVQEAQIEEPKDYSPSEQIIEISGNAEPSNLVVSDEKTPSSDTSEVTVKESTSKLSSKTRKNKSAIEKGRKRSSSVDESQIEVPIKRKTRATSVPKMNTIAEENSPTKEKKVLFEKSDSRASSESKEVILPSKGTPYPAKITERRKSIAQEDNTPGGETPSRTLTRKRSSSLLRDEIESPMTPRTTRARSKPPLEVVPENEDTPSKSTRKRHAESDDSQEPKLTRARSQTPSQTPPDTQATSAKKPRSRRGSTSTDLQESLGDTPSKNLRSRKRSTDQVSEASPQDDDAKSDKSSVSKRRFFRASSKPPTEPPIQEEGAEQPIDYSKTRRLTRGQLAVLEKISKAKAAAPVPKPSQGNSEREDSDNESVMSQKSTPESVKSKSSRVSKASTKSKTTRGKRGVSVVSTTSTGSKKRGRTPKKSKDSAPEKEENAPGPARTLRARKGSTTSK